MEEEMKIGDAPSRSILKSRSRSRGARRADPKAANIRGVLSRGKRKRARKPDDLPIHSYSWCARQGKIASVNHVSPRIIVRAVAGDTEIVDHDFLSRSFCVPMYHRWRRKEGDPVVRSTVPVLVL